MLDTLIAAGIVLAAAVGVACGLYRGATGKSKCSGCSDCDTDDAHEAECNRGGDRHDRESQT